MNIKRETCNGCGISFQYAPNSEGTRPTGCLRCDPENERAVPIRSFKIGTEESFAEALESVPLDVAVAKEWLARGMGGGMLALEARTPRGEKKQRLAARERERASKAASRKRAEAVRADH